MSDVCIIGQGPNYDYEKFCLNLHDVDVIYSTWENERNTFQHMNNPKHEVLFNTIPKDPGIKNLNLQIYSILKGLERSMEMGHKFSFKVRNDMCILDYKSLYSCLQIDSFNFIAWTTHAGGYFLDYVFGGPTDLMYEFFSNISYNVTPGDFPERILTREFIKFFKKNKIEEVNYILKPAIESSIFSLGRHTPNYNSKKWEESVVFSNEYTSNGTWV
tara:strand:+ start:2826 stop:3473 length:648 start_codon:yes stop_codon:yes gene_type:complete